jgi:flagellar biosynthesis/type III secretory pathway chaperone
MSDRTTLRTNLNARLQEMVAEELAAVRGVLEILVRESAALLARDVGLLPGISNSKADAVAHVAGLVEQRQGLLQANPDLGEAEVGSALAELRALALQCREQNEANGLLIRGQRRRIESALRILQGGVPGVDTYGRNGAATQLRRSSRGPLAAW